MNIETELGILDRDAEIERLSLALEKIEQIIADREKCLLLPTVQEIKEIWNIARNALKMR